MARCSSPRHLRAMVGDDVGDRRKSRFWRRAATRIGRVIRICHHADRRQRRCRGSVADLSIRRSVDQVGRHCVSAFHCVATRAAAPAGDTQGFEFYRLEAAFVSGSPLPFSTPIRKHGCSLRLPPDRSWRAMRPSPVSQLLLLCFRSLPSAVLSLARGCPKTRKAA
jgi:hypothetical protein